jgi:hypothetical protein
MLFVTSKDFGGLFGQGGGQMNEEIVFPQN